MCDKKPYIVSVEVQVHAKNQFDARKQVREALNQIDLRYELTWVKERTR